MKAYVCIAESKLPRWSHFRHHIDNINGKVFYEMEIHKYPNNHYGIGPYILSETLNEYEYEEDFEGDTIKGFVIETKNSIYDFIQIKS